MRKIEVATSFSRKINLANYGGPAFESEDVFISLKEELEMKEDQNQTDSQQIEAYVKGANKFLQSLGEQILAERIAKLKK